MRIGVLASGQLGMKNLEELHRNIPVQFVFTDMKSKEIVDYAKRMLIPFYVGSPRKKEAIEFLLRLGVTTDLLISVNYLFLLDETLISFPLIGAINIHGSLLPKYRGRTPHVWAIINNEAETGITVHYIDKACDTGDIIIQERFRIESHYTGWDVLQEFQKRYPSLIIKVIDMFREGFRRGTPQDGALATFFGKRTPEDGKINWDWQRERIYNWVRAQADPYPGAFTYYGRDKLIIDQVESSNLGFSWEMENGFVIQGGKFPAIKTPNGVLRIKRMRSNLEIETGKLLT